MTRQFNFSIIQNGVWFCFVCLVYIYSIYLLTGVSSYKVDLDSKMVVVMGDILPFEVLESVSKVKNAELLKSHDDKE